MSNKKLYLYRQELQAALKQDFQRQALDKFVSSYRQGQQKSFAGLDRTALVQEISKIKKEAIANLETLLSQFCQKAREAGVTVHLAHTAHQANEIILNIAKENQCKKIIKSKSMTAEETLLNHHLENAGLEVTETDLGEWIIQLRKERPSHMVMPAIHLSKEEVQTLFGKVTGQKIAGDITALVRVARQELRDKFIQADMGISGANFALANTGTLGIITNEGNARLVTTLPRVHVSLVGVDKLLPGLREALIILQGLPRNATGQAISTYVTWITGANTCQSSSSGKKIMHIVFLDNGRFGLSKDPMFADALKCVRCGACANVCPVYRLIGGHKLGHIYIGAIGMILTHFYHGLNKAQPLVQNCLNCQACQEVCIAGIDLPRLIKNVQILTQELGEDKKSIQSSVSRIITNRKLFHGLLKLGKTFQAPLKDQQGHIRHLPLEFFKEQGFKKLPALARKPFRDTWKKKRPHLNLSKSGQPRLKIALFAGCLQDFIYPEQLWAGVKILTQAKVQVEFPLEQGCCGLPVYMLGQREDARVIALHNMRAIDASSFDYLVTLCASCGSHLKKNYPLLFADQPGLVAKSRIFAKKIIDFASFLTDILDFKPQKTTTGLKVAYHAPCHLCRGLNVRRAPYKLLERLGTRLKTYGEEETCCGLGGTYSLKFPELSAEILKNKLDLIKTQSPEVLVTDCPGCILQLRGGVLKHNLSFKVLHLAELLANVP